MMRKWRLLLLATLSAPSLFAALPTSSSGLRRAPVNPAYLAFLSNRMDGVAHDVHNGFRPSPLDLSHLAAAYKATPSSSGGRPRLTAAAPLPSSWDSRKQGWVTPIKNQGNHGTCWAHAVMACLETQLLKNEEDLYDLSENHLAAHRKSGFLWGFDDGGNNAMAAALLTAWNDPLLETQDPHPNPSATVDLPPVRHVQDIVWLPARESSLDNDTIKRAIMDDGAVAVSYCHSNACVSATTNAYYYSSGTVANHAVTAIGWDDDFPASAFRTTPAGNGAFLVKNSWGKGGSMPDGCLWISYYDTSFCASAPAVYPLPQATNNYGRVYSHDENGCVDATGYSYYDGWNRFRLVETAWCANVFTCVSTGIVSAVGFYAMVPQTAFEVSVYTNVTAAGPKSGVRIVQQTGTLATAGYHTVDLQSEVPLTCLGERFSVVIKLTTPNYGYPLAYDVSYPGYCESVASSGESFASANGQYWEDVSAGGMNFCVKAYTRYGSDGPEGYVLKAFVDLGAGGGVVTPAETVVVPGSAATFVASEDHPFVRFETNGVFATDEPVFTWSDVRADGEIVAFFGTTNFCVDAATGDDAADGWTWETAKRTIAAATDLAGRGDVIRVKPGVYDGFASYALSSVITAVEGPDKTVIDGGGTNSCVCDYWDYAEGIPSVYEGFTLRNGYDPMIGGGVYCGTYVGCVISNGWSGGAGGGAAYATLSDCLLVNNRAGIGGGAYGCTLYGCTVTENEASQSGGISVSEAGGAVNAIVTGNAPDDVDEARWTMSTLIGVDAKFVDAANGNWRLTARSPAVDAGSNAWATTAVDLDGTNRIYGARVDIGCYEYCHEPEGWPVPKVAPDATPAEEAAAVSETMREAGFSVETAAAVTTAADYAKITSWAEANGVSAAEQTASPTALLSPALDADGLIEIESNGLHIASLTMTTNAVATPIVKMTLSLADYEAVKADASLLKAAIGVTGADDLTKVFTADDLSVEVEKGTEAVEIFVVPPAAAPTYFLRTKVR